MNSTCNICKGNSPKIFDALVLGKYAVEYFQCSNCRFIQTESPSRWIKEAYSNAMTALDIGILYRNTNLAAIMPEILDGFSTENDAYLDYGGGYGIFVRMMRDKGYNFYLFDKYADNLFAKHFSLDKFKFTKKFTCVTAFEVFEHLENPLAEIELMFNFSDTIIFSTDLQPKATFHNVDDWEYFIPITGQHISLFSYGSLIEISRYFSCFMYSNGFNIHILTKRKLDVSPFGREKDNKSLLERLANKVIFKLKQSNRMHEKESLLLKDYQNIKDLISNVQS